MISDMMTQRRRTAEDLGKLAKGLREYRHRLKTEPSSGGTLLGSVAEEHFRKAMALIEQAEAELRLGHYANEAQTPTLAKRM